MQVPGVYFRLTSPLAAANPSGILSSSRATQLHTRLLPKLNRRPWSVSVQQRHIIVPHLPPLLVLDRSLIVVSN
jgi:hypothetical protein